MVNKETLYTAFGELIYTVAMADGLIQESEMNKLEELLKNHAWAADIKWSFDYEVKAKNDLKDTYEKALITFKEHGPDPEYKFLIDVLEEVAQASKGMWSEEADQIIDFEADLRKEFIEKLNAENLVIE